MGCLTMDQMKLLLILALGFAVLAACVSIACLIRIDQLGVALGQPPRGRGRGSQRLTGRGKLVQWPRQRPHR